MTKNSSAVRPLHCLSFDIEEHFHVSAFESPLRRRHWESFESRVEKNTNLILTLLSEQQVHATFFILGWVAERHPGLVRTISNLGHEIASHGFAHELITAQTPTQFRNDIRKTKAILEDLTGKNVLGYRAPSFSITKDTTWSIPILVEEGYIYDSSIFPVLHDRYGIPGAKPGVHSLSTASGDIIEVPPSTVAFAGTRIPIAGGGYFRLMPYRLFQFLLQKVEQEESPLVTYLHPWELDPNQPKMKGPLLSQFRHYLNLHKTQSRLARLLRSFQFGPICQVVSQIAERAGQGSNFQGKKIKDVCDSQSNEIVINSGEDSLKPGDLLEKEFLADKKMQVPAP